MGLEFPKPFDQALLVSNENAVFDVKEAHLAFRRQSSEPAIKSGMPTLRRFIRPSDWDRMEKMFDIVTNLPPSDVQQRCTFRHPMLFRLPGESPSYLRSRQTSVYLAGEVVPDHPVHFWMNFSSFDTSQICRPRVIGWLRMTHFLEIVILSIFKWF